MEVTQWKQERDLFKGGLSLAEGGRRYGENEPSIHSSAESSVHPEPAWGFQDGGLLGTMEPWIPKGLLYITS
jgi:hypothetical protein